MMAELPKIISKIEAGISYYLDSQIEFIRMDDIEKDKLLFQICLNEDEKQLATKKEIAKMQKVLAKCKPPVAGYVLEILNEHNYTIFKEDYYSLRLHLCKSFLTEFYESINEFALLYYDKEKDVEDEGDSMWDLACEDEEYGFNTRLIRVFIKNMAVASRFLSFRDFLNSPEQNSNEAIVNNKQESFETIITPDKATFILNMLEVLSITSNGNSILGDRKKSALRGVVEACKDKNLLPPMSIDKLCSLIAAKINLELKAKLDFSNTAKSFKKLSITYIEKHYTK